MGLGWSVFPRKPGGPFWAERKCFDAPPAFREDAIVSASSNHPLTSLVPWLVQYTRFPAARLPQRAELMLIMSAIQEQDSGGVSTSTHFERRRAGETASQRAHALMRSRVHFKCDNSAKV